MVAKVNRTDFRPEDGIAIMVGVDEATGAVCEIAVPLAAFPKLSAEARRFMYGMQAKASQQPSYGQMHYAELCTAQTYQVGTLPTTEGEKIALILDRGLVETTQRLCRTSLVGIRLSSGLLSLRSASIAPSSSLTGKHTT